MALPSTLKIDVKKILKEHLYHGASAVYLDAAIWENKDGPDKFGNTHYVTQSVSKEARERGEKGAIIGNIKMVGGTAAPRPAATALDADLDDQIPF